MATSGRCGMKPSQLIIFLIVPVLICVVGLSQAESSQERNIGGIEAAALESDTRCPGLLAALGKGLPQEIGKGEHEIPPICWSDAIKQLKPVKVYDHRLNVAIVL